jgi:hypothetical protein
MSSFGSTQVRCYSKSNPKMLAINILLETFGTFEANTEVSTYYGRQTLASAAIRKSITERPMRTLKLTAFGDAYTTETKQTLIIFHRITIHASYR